MRRGGPLVEHPGRAALIATLIVLAVGAYAFKPSLVQGHRFELTGIFQSSQGLTKGAPVRVAGYDIGRVVGLERGPGNTAEVRMELEDSAPPLYSDTTLRVRPRIFLEGGFYIQLNPGIAPDSTRLHSGATIGLPQTAIAVQSDQPLSRLDSKARADSATILHELATAFSGDGPRQIRGLTREAPETLRVSAIAAHAAQGLHPGELSRLIQNAAATSGALAPVTRELEASVVDGDRTLRALAQHAADLGQTISLADSALRETPATLKAIDRTLPVLDRYTTVARPVLARLPRSLRSTATLLTQTTELSRSSALPSLLRRLTPTINRLPTFERRQVPLFRYVEPVSTCVTEKVTPVLNAKIQDGTLSTGRPAWLDLLHGFTNAAGAAQNFDGNGPYVRYESGLSEQLVSTGDVPGAGTLVGITTTPLLGIRPLWNGPTPPPFHPETDCRTQAVPSLTATAGAVPKARKLDPALLKTPKVRKLIKGIAKAAGR